MAPTTTTAVRRATDTTTRYLRGAVIRARSAVGFPSSTTILVTGAGRSGTTWIGEMIAEAVDGWLYFEPDHPRRGRAVADRNASTEDRIEVYRRLAAGRHASNWSVRDVGAFLTRRRIVLKSIRATDIVPELVDAGVFARPIVVIRHPCAVIASRSVADFTPPTVEQIERSGVLDDVPQLAPFVDRSEYARFAIGWVVTYLPVADRSDVLVLPYEQVLLDPGGSVADALAHLGLAGDVGGLESSGRASFTTVPGTLQGGADQLTKWTTQLDADAIGDVMAVTEAAGITMYGPDAAPRAPTLTGRS